MELTQQQKVHAQVVQATWEDAQFKKDLMAKPEEAIERLTGFKMNIPQGQTLVVVDQTDESKLYLNIPRKVDIDTLELTDEQLEMVAGGTDFTVAVGYGLIALAAVGASFAFGYSMGKDSATADAPKK